jgi:hypothetical protein
VARRVTVAMSGVHPNGLAEPSQPDPSSTDATNSVPDDHRQPRWLQAVVRNVDRIEATPRRTGQRGVISSFLWMVPDSMSGMASAIPRSRQHLTRFYPLGYADVQRLADYQNRVLRNWSKSRKIDFVDTAASFPYDPSLFADAIHLNERGQRIQAWIVFQGLVLIIERMLETGELPRPAGAGSPFNAAERAGRISVPVETLAAHCGNPWHLWRNIEPGARARGSRPVAGPTSGPTIEPGEP